MLTSFNGTLAKASTFLGIWVRFSLTSKKADKSQFPTKTSRINFLVADFRLASFFAISGVQLSAYVDSGSDASLIGSTGFRFSAPDDNSDVASRRDRLSSGAGDPLRRGQRSIPDSQIRQLRAVQSRDVPAAAGRPVRNAERRRNSDVLVRERCRHLAERLRTTNGSASGPRLRHVSARAALRRQAASVSRERPGGHLVAGTGRPTVARGRSTPVCTR